MTYSVLARDEATGRLGVAVQSRFFAVGRSVPWAEAGVGVIATQGVVEPGYGAEGIAQLRTGRSPADVLAELVASDPGEPARQVALLSADGETAAHTGAGCVAAVAHREVPGVSAQGNMLRSPAVIDALVEGFGAASGDLEARLLAALDAAEAAGGDVRGRQSAALLVVDATRSDAPWEHVIVDVRVDDHPEPLKELRRLADVSGFYDRLLALVGTPGLFIGEERATDTQVEEALDALRSGPRLGDGNPDFVLWEAVLLARTGNVAEGRLRLDEAASLQESLRLFAYRLAAAGCYTPQVAEKLTDLREVDDALRL